MYTGYYFIMYYEHNFSIKHYLKFVSNNIHKQFIVIYVIYLCYH